MKNTKAVSPIQAEQAIQLVLQAEQDAERAIYDSENEVQLLIQGAQTDAQRILARTDQRITNIEMRHEHQLNQLIKSIENQGSAELKHDASQRVDQKSLQNIVEKLASEMCQAFASSEDTVESGQ
jgi:vacuolar-type H+-ATPase subunit H